MSVTQYPQGSSVRNTTRSQGYAKKATANSIANSRAFSAMTPCQRQTGKTAADLTREQANLKAQFLQRDARRRAA